MNYNPSLGIFGNLLALFKETNNANANSFNFRNEAKNHLDAARVELEQQVTDAYLDNIKAQQDITDLYLEIIGG